MSKKTHWKSIPSGYNTYISEVGGKEALADPNREIGFGFVSCSCRACVRAGEAKLRERVRDDAFSSLVARIARCAPPVTWIWW